MLKLATKENVLGALILGLSILGARLQSNPILYTMLFLICLSLLLVAFDKLKTSPLLIFCIGLGMLYQTTLMSPYLIGTDIQAEFYVAHLTYMNHHWNYSMPFIYNSAMGIALFAPFFSLLSHISLYWVFKALLPLFLAGVPVLLFYIYKKEFGDKASFLACFLLMAVPTFFTELVSSTRQQMAEFVLVSLFGLLLLRWKSNWKYLLVFILLVIVGLLHYSMGAIAYIYLGAFVSSVLAFRYILKTKIDIKLKILMPLILVSILIYGGYLHSVAGGRPYTAVTYLTQYLTKWVPTLWEGRANPITPSDLLPGNNTDIPPILHITSTGVTEGGNVTEDKGGTFLNMFTPVTRVALGLDFMEASTLGKVFRVLQILTQLMVIIGLVVVVRSWKKYSPKFLSLIAGAVLILVLVLLLPGFSAVLNATRFYQIALLLLSPIAIVGGLRIFRSPKVLSCILVLYLVFTSGLIYEITKQTRIGTDLPYSYALSSNRVGVAGLYTLNDGKVRDFILDNPEVRPVYSDLHGTFFLQNFIWPTEGINFLHYTYKLQPDNAYVFLTEWSEGHQSIVYWVDIGEKLVVPYNEPVTSMDTVLEGRQIIYQAGLAKLYGPKGGE